MADDRLTQIKARVEAATPGPWHVDRHEPSLSRLVRSHDGTLDIDFGYVGNCTQPDAEFVAHAPDDVQWLVNQLERARSIAVELENENARLANELGRYVGKEPTVAEEMSFLSSCLGAVRDLCDRARQDARRWEQPLPEPEWVAAVEEAASGNRPDDPDDTRRRIYIDGEGQAWIDSTEGDDGEQYLAQIEWPLDDGELLDTIRERTGGLREIGRTW
ncbi:hypothetical protein AB0B79_31505 [Streptomyces sp. NPDC039022]|uniref:hypothetical protein n=1 Tax=Streptomyces sp. NPDC039022 TaxID=3157091 RepID=UPI0033E2E085